MQLASNEYQCCLCGNVYTKEVSDEEAMEETHEYWPDVEMEQCGIVCDDCWQKVRPDSIGFRQDTYTKADETLIIDDPNDGSVEPSATKEWIRHTFTLRLNGEQEALLIVKSRIHESNLPGQLSEQGEWEHLHLPFEKGKDDAK